MSTDYIIGIDFGTTYSCVAVWKNGHVEIIPNDIGMNTTPSCVSFTETERYIGQLAKDNSLRNPQNTIYDIKRLLGRKIDDPSIQNDLKHWPFTVIHNQQKQPIIAAKYREKTQNFYPEEISAMIMEKLKMFAEDYLGQKVTKAVITVPAYFNDSQRQATSDAAKIAGLNCVRIINEPTAAALTYGLDKRCPQEKLVLIFDLGGGTLDVSLLAIENGTFEVIATSGDAHLGGEDFDNRMVTFICNEFNQLHKNCDIKTNLKALRKLKSACEKTKIALSASMRSVIDIDALHDNRDFTYTFTRSKFEELCMDLFKKCLAPVQRVLDDAQIKKEHIHEIVLVGGSTRIPYIQQQLKDFFNGKELNKSVHPDEAVAYGAAIQGSILSKIPDSITNDIILLDVTPLSLGVETAGGIMSFIIERNTPIPCTKKDLYTTYTDNQKAVTINIFEGERHMTQYNNKLGQFDLVDITPAPRGVPQIEVTFEIDNNGILTVSAIDTMSSNKNQISIVKNKGRLNETEITRLIKDADRYRKEDLEMKAQIEMKNKVEALLYQTRNNLIEPEISEKISVEEKNRLLIAINNLRKWLDENPNASIADYDQKKIPLEQLRNIILTRIYSNIPKTN
jgi:L1 cell adhesion molecule like protein